MALNKDEVVEHLKEGWTLRFFDHLDHWSLSPPRSGMSGKAVNRRSAQALINAGIVVKDRFQYVLHPSQYDPRTLTRCPRCGGENLQTAYIGEKKLCWDCNWPGVDKRPKTSGAEG